MPCRSPYYVTIAKTKEDVPVPCGRCPHCKKRRVNDWVFRLREEDKVSNSGYFVTLTYNTSSVPLVKNGMSLSKYEHKFVINRKTWKVKRNKTKSNDLTLFFKKLRKYGEKFKYYAVGEYGTKTYRPHYHIIFFGIKKIDHIFKAWTNSTGSKLGHIHIGDVTTKSIAYTLKYIDKEKRIPQYEGDERIPEYSIMSKNLGKRWLDNENIKKYYSKNWQINFLYTEEGYKISMPSYYRNQILSEEMKKVQRHYIDTVVNEKEEQARQSWKDKRYDYDHHKELKKIAEWNKFQKQINKRDKI